MITKRLGTVQKFAKAMLYAVTFILPFAAIMIAIGSIMMSPYLLGDLPYIGGISAFLGKNLNSGGWAILANLPFFFALCVAASLSGEKSAGPVIIAGLFFIVLHKLIGELSVIYFGEFKGYEGIQSVKDLLSPVANPDYINIFQDVFGMPTFRIGIVGAIIVGVLSAHIWEKYKTFDKLPMALDFFNGQRFCVFVTFLYAFIMAMVLMLVWPSVGDGLDAFSVWAAERGAYVTPFIKGFTEVALRPIGMHHVTNAVWEYTPVGGEFYSELKDATIIGLHQVCPARLDEAVQMMNIGRISDATNIVHDPMMCKMMFTADFHGMFTLPGAALGMYFAIPKERRTAKVKSIYVSTTMAVIFTGFAEPLEFMFVFASPILYAVNVALYSVASILPDILTSITGDNAMLTWYLRGVPNVVASGLLQVGWILGRWSELLIWLVCGLAFFSIYAISFRWLIVKYDIIILGREPEGEEAEVEENSLVAQFANMDTSRSEGILKALGGKDNILSIGNCFTRLRVEIKDMSLVNTDKKTWQKMGAVDIVVLDGAIQAIYGTKVNNLRIQLEDYMATV